MSTIIAVTQADIDEGQKKECHHCPIAIASMRALGAEKVDVGYQMFHAYIGGVRLVYEMPPKAKAFARAFDVDLDMKPFTFELGEPE